MLSRDPGERDPRAPVALALQMNGQRRPVSVNVRTGLLDALSDRLGLAGAKKGCDHGQCRACTVRVDALLAH